ncbi:MAG: hypothetical protein Q4C55_05420 [Eubacterium sp.]|nr:hypothetical protein [Eubacterium sp.]
MKSLRSYLVVLCAAFLLVLCGCTDLSNPADVLSDASLSSQADTALQDGTYTAASAYLSPQGYGSRLTAEVHQGIITKVSFEEIDAQGSRRPDTRWEGADKSLNQIYTQLYSSFIEGQSTEFDAVTGATQTTDVFKALGDCILKAAASGDTALITTDAYPQTYTAESQPDAQGIRGRLSVTYEDEAMIQVVYDEYQNGNSLSAGVTEKQIFGAMAKETLSSQSLAPLSSSPGSAEETSRYNGLLQSIALQRVSFISN